MKHYKIRRNSDGKFSTGGMSPRFTKTGKMWRLGNLKSHLALFRVPWRPDKKVNHIYKDCKVVEFELIETDCKTNPGQLYLEETMFREI